MNKKQSIMTKTLGGRLAGSFILFLVTGLCFALTPSASFAQSGGGTPPANTKIGTQASATYTDNSGNVQTVTSNEVITMVRQIFAVSVNGGTTQSANAGGQVLFPQTITNTGNGTDSFDLTTDEGSGSFKYGNVFIYADRNADGVPDNTNLPITKTGSLAAGETFSVVFIADIPANAANGDAQILYFTASSAKDNSTPSNATDRATNKAIISDVVVNVTKSMSRNGGSAGDSNPVTVTLTYTNSGTSDASNLIITDDLDLRFIYKPGTAKVNNAAVTDADNPSTDAYFYNESGGTKGGG